MRKAILEIEGELGRQRRRLASLATTPPAPAPPTPTPTSTRKFLDIAVNFTDPMFRGEYRGKQAHADDRDLILARAASVGCTQWLITGGNLEESRAAVQLCKDYKHNPHGIEMRCTVGCHPTRCSEFETGETTIDGLKEVIVSGLAEGVVAAIGECGLDYDREEFCPREVQKKWFEAQLQLAHSFQLPLFLHNRSTEGDFEKVLHANKAIFTRGCSHSFTGDATELQSLLATGVAVGINGASLRAEYSQEMITSLPMDRILLETDAPWCDIRATHPGHSLVKTTFPQVKNEKKFELGKTVKNRQEPCHIVQVFEVLCGWKGVTDASEVTKAETLLYNNAAKMYWGA